MKITIFGASGKVGRLVVDKLLVAGHQVTVFVHSSGSFEESDKLAIVKGDVHNAADVIQAVDGADLVISTLGSWGTKQKDILGSAMQNLIPIIGNRRIITLTGSAAQAPGDVITTGNKISHAVFGLIAKPILIDGESHLKQLSESKANWTSLRAGIMKNGPAKSYVLNQKLPGAFETVSRNTIVQAIIDQISATDQIGQAPHIHG